MVYFWQIPDDYPERLIGEYDRTKSGNRFALKKAERVPSGFAAPVFNFPCSISELRVLDDLANSAMVPLISPRVTKILQSLSVEVQLLPSTVVATDGTITDYSTLVALNAVNAIDLPKSMYSCVPGTDKVMGFTSVCMLPDPLGSRHLARTAEYSSYLIASQVLRDALLRQGVQGLGLYAPDELTL